MFIFNLAGRDQGVVKGFGLVSLRIWIQSVNFEMLVVWSSMSTRSPMTS